MRTMKVNKGLGLPVVPLPSVGHMPAPWEERFINAAYEGRGWAVIAMLLIASCANYTGATATFGIKTFIPRTAPSALQLA